MQKGFSLIELLIVIAIIAIILSFGIPWSMNYVAKKKIESSTQTIYLAIKKAQMDAKLKKQSYCITLQDNTYLVVKNGTCSDGDTVDNETLSVPFQIKADFGKDYFQVNQFGIFTIGGSIYYNATSSDVLSCVKVGSLRVCEGYWDGSECICKY